MKFLITGGAGFLGSHITDDLIQQGHEVTIIDNLSGGFKENIPKKAEFFDYDIRDTAIIDLLFATKEFDYVYHCAAYAAEGLSHWIRKYNYETNVIGSINLINASIKYKVKGFIFTSSMAVYGTQQVPYSEEMKPQPEDPYGIAKYSIEQDLKTANKMFGLPYMIFRPHNIYGIRQNIGDRYRNVIGIFMNQAMKNEPITIYGDGEQTRAFSYIDDMNPIMSRAWDKPKMYGQIFNIGGDKPYSINELAMEVLKNFNTKSEIINLPERYEVKHAYSKHVKVRKHFTLEQTELTEGLKIMSEWAKSVGAKESKSMTLELQQDIYEAFA